MKAVSVLSTITKIDDAGNRDFINVYNNGGETLFIQYDGGDPASLTTANGWPVPPGTWFTISNDGNRNVYGHAVYGICATGPVDVRVQGA